MYIEINLLPQQFRPKRKFNFDIKTAMVLFLIVSVSVVGGYYFYIIKSLKKINNEIVVLKTQEKHLQELLDFQEEVDSLKTVISKKVDIIKELTRDSDVRLEMITHLNNILPENLWLLNITETNENSIIWYRIDGMAYSKESISKFLEGLSRFEKFTKISLESITPAPLEIRDAFNFSIRVDLVNLSPISIVPNKAEEQKEKPDAKSKPVKKVKK